MDRIAWDDLPGPLKQAIEARTGPVIAARTATAGQNSPLAAIIRTSAGTIFAKGMPSDHRRVVTQAREAAVAPLVRDISPALRWHFDEAGWNVLGYEYVVGRHADYTPGSPDLDALVRLMRTLSEITVPNPGPFKWAEDRWRAYLDEPELAGLLSGGTLTHSDWTPDNVLVSGGRAWLIDWAWPTLGAGWTDPACWVLRLMASGGHTAREAERQAARHPAFEAADPAHIDMFASANVRLWAEVAQSSPGPWTNEMAQAARAWLSHRQTRKVPGSEARDHPLGLPRKNSELPWDLAPPPDQRPAAPAGRPGGV
jgi:hypothetical protein